MSEDSYIAILAMLIGNIISIASGIIISRHAARYAHRLTARKDNQEETAQPSRTENGVYAKKIRRDRIIIVLVDVAMFALDAWFLWSLTSNKAPLNRADTFWITFYTLFTFYFGNRLLNDILGNSALDQIMSEARMDKLKDEKLELLVENHILLRKKVEEIEAGGQQQAVIASGENQSKGRTKRASKKGKAE
jgi:hypothetical protein